MSRFFRLTELEAYVPGEQPKGIANLIKLNTNESPFPPSPKVKEAIDAAAIDALRLYPDPGSTGVVSAIAEHYGISEKNVCVCNSSDEVLAFTFNGLCKNGAVFADLTYGFYPVFCKFFGIEFEEIPLKEDFSLDVSDYTGKKGTVYIANPNAPTGIYKPLSDIRCLLEQDKDRLIVVDEAYVDFGGESAVSLINEYDNLLVIQTFSKSRQLAGGRLGFCMGNEEIIADMNTLRYSFNPYSVNRISMLAGEAAMRDVEYFEKCRNEIIVNREYTVSELNRLGFTVTDSKTNFVFATNPSIDAAVYVQKLRDRGIIIRYFGSKERIKDYVRITIGTLDEMRALISATEDILKDGK